MPLPVEQPQDGCFGFIVELHTADSVGCTVTIFATLAILVASFYCFSDYSATRNRALLVVAISTSVLLVNGLIFWIRSRHRRRPKSGRALVIANKAVYSGDCRVLLGGPVPAVPATLNAQIDLEGLVPILIAGRGDLKLALVAESVEGRPPREITSVSLFEGEQLLGTVRRGDHGTLWCLDGQVATLLRDPKREIFSAIPVVLDVVSKSAATKISLALVIVLRRESIVGPALMLGAIGSALVDWANSSNRKKLEELIADGHLKDPKSGENILDFSERLGFEIVVHA